MKRPLQRVALVFMFLAIPGQFATAQEGPVLESQSAPPPLPNTASIVNTPPPLTAFEKIDSVFKQAVNTLDSILFYRLGDTFKEYIVFEKDLIYWRVRGTQDAFQLLNADPANDNRELDPSEVEIKAAQGELLPGDVVNGESKYYRLGTLDNVPIEYLTLKQKGPTDAISYGTRFRFDPATDEFRIIQKKRNQLGDLTVSPSEVASWAELGHLKLNPSPIDPARPYLFRESVGGIPIVVAWLGAGAVFFTLFMRGFNVWGFRHAVDVIRGRYDNPEETGEVTHFQTLASALSATVGLGNIAGVTIAMTIGGPGAFFWMLLCGIFGMCSKFAECSLAVKYRTVKPDGTVLGGPMRYLYLGFKEIRLGGLGAVLATIFTVMCVLASFGGGNMLQANQSGSAVLQMIQQNELDELGILSSKIRDAAAAGNQEDMKSLQAARNTLQDKLAASATQFKLIYGVVLAFLVGIVILGGIKRIAAAAEKIVPAMCLVYSAACLYIILSHVDRLPELIMSVFTEAWTGAAMGGGLVGVLVVGVQRAAFSNEAGAGSAAIAHSAAKTDEPIREGCVALLEPFIDTVIICSMTALVILITGAWDNSEWIVDQGLQGAALTSRAFREEISWFPIVLSVSVALFAYSTIISWSYYGERAWETLFGSRSINVYRTLTIFFVFVGTIVNLGSVLDFSDMMILGMAFPNILGVVLLSPMLRRDLFDYWKRYQAGEFKKYH